MRLLDSFTFYQCRPHIHRQAKLTTWDKPPIPSTPQKLEATTVTIDAYFLLWMDGYTLLCLGVLDQFGCLLIPIFVFFFGATGLLQWSGNRSQGHQKSKASERLEFWSE